MVSTMGGLIMATAGTLCSVCGDEVDPLELFPKQRCLQCHANAIETRVETRFMTADRLAAMWGMA